MRVFKIKKNIFWVICAVITANNISYAKTQKKLTVSKECNDVLNTVFECTTPNKHKILVCAEKNRFEYRYIRASKTEDDTVINVASNRLKMYPLYKNKEALGFLTATKEYQVFAHYKKSVDPNNVYDDNIAGGVRIVQNGKQIGFAKCASSPDSISISDVIDKQVKKMNANKASSKKQKKANKKTTVKKKNSSQNLASKNIASKNTASRTTAKQKVQPSKTKKSNADVAYQAPYSMNGRYIPKQKKEKLPKYVKNIENLIEFLED